MSAFADAEIIRLARDKFIPVTCDDWYQRRRTDAEGKFFRKVSDQTDRKAAGATGTRQGIYVFTADGEALAYKNAGNLAGETRKQLKQALAKFEQLPATRRAPGAVTIEPRGTPDANYDRQLPPGGLAAKVHARILDRVGSEFETGRCDTLGGSASARDFLWLTADDVRSLAPAKREVGSTYPLPATIANRLARFHLVDFTRGEPPFWEADQVHKLDLTLTVTSVTDTGVELRLDGVVVCATDADLMAAERGYDSRVTGRITLTGPTVTQFDLASVGEHWGEGPHTGSARPGRSLLGITVGPVIALNGSPADRVPPQAARDLAEYLGGR